MAPFRVLPAVVAVLLLGLCQAPARAASAVELVQNGSFEQGEPIRGPWTPLVAGSPAIAHWEIRGRVDYVESYWQASDGKRSVDLDGTPGPGAIAQTIATQVGKRYRLRFDLAANPEGPPRIKRLLVTVGSQAREFDFDMTGHAKSAMGYRRETWTFVAVAPRTTIVFASLSRAGNWNGPVLDNVSVVEAGAELPATSSTVSGPPSAKSPAPSAPATSEPAPSRGAAPSAPVGLNGDWRGSYRGKTLVLHLDQRNGAVVAWMIQADPALGLARMRWNGDPTRGAFVVLQECTFAAQPKPMWFGSTVTIRDAGTFVFAKNNCLREDVTFTRER